MFEIGDKAIVIFNENDWYGYIVKITKVFEAGKRYHVAALDQINRPGKSIFFTVKHLIKLTKINKLLYGRS